MRAVAVSWVRRWARSAVRWWPRWSVAYAGECGGAVVSAPRLLCIPAGRERGSGSARRRVAWRGGFVALRSLWYSVGAFCCALVARVVGSARGGRGGAGRDRGGRPPTVPSPEPDQSTTAPGNGQDSQAPPPPPATRNRPTRPRRRARTAPPACGTAHPPRPACRSSARRPTPVTLGG